MSRAAIVLCGGRSSRMGRAKAWLPWFGLTLIEHVVTQLAQVVDEVIVVTSASLDLPSLPARIVRDRDPARAARRHPRRIGRHELRVCVRDEHRRALPDRILRVTDVG